MTNPWNLTPRECATLAAVAEYGCTKLAARKLGVTGKTIEQHIRAAKRAMGLPHRTQAVIAWDRHARVEGWQVNDGL
jgi:DNA-binding NarL/FixJ family response regulator